MERAGTDLSNLRAEVGPDGRDFAPSVAVVPKRVEASSIGGVLFLDLLRASHE